MKKALRRHGSPEAITTDGLRSYGAALAEHGTREKQDVGARLTTGWRNPTCPSGDENERCCAWARCELYRSSSKSKPTYTKTYLYAPLQGMAVQAGSGATLAELEQVVTTNMMLWPKR